MCGVYMYIYGLSKVKIKGEHKKKMWINILQ